MRDWSEDELAAVVRAAADELATLPYSMEWDHWNNIIAVAVDALGDVKADHLT